MVIGVQDLSYFSACKYKYGNLGLRQDISYFGRCINFKVTNEWLIIPFSLVERYLLVCRSSVGQ